MGQEEVRARKESVQPALEPIWVERRSRGASAQTLLSGNQILPSDIRRRESKPVVWLRREAFDRNDHSEVPVADPDARLLLGFLTAEESENQPVSDKQKSEQPHMTTKPAIYSVPQTCPIQRYRGAGGAEDPGQGTGRRCRPPLQKIGKRKGGRKGR